MSVIDLIVGLLMLWAVFNGWRQGLILQLCSLAGIVLGAWLGIRFGTEAGALLHLDEEFAAAGGFLAVFVVVLIAVAVRGTAVRKVFISQARHPGPTRVSRYRSQGRCWSSGCSSRLSNL